MAIRIYFQHVQQVVDDIKILLYFSLHNSTAPHRYFKILEAFSIRGLPYHCEYSPFLFRLVSRAQEHLFRCEVYLEL